MSRNCNIINADGRVFELPDFWQDSIGPKCEDRAPEVFDDIEGQQRQRIEGKVLVGP